MKITARMEFLLCGLRTFEMVDTTTLVGRCFVWEPANANATCMIVVVSVERNEEREWFVECANIATGERYWNEFLRFDEATRLSYEQLSELLAGEKDCARILPGHPLYASAKAAVAS